MTTRAPSAPAPSPALARLVHADQRAARKCRFEDCGTEYRTRVRRDGEPIQVCSKHAAELLGSDKDVLVKALGSKGGWG